MEPKLWSIVLFLVDRSLFSLKSPGFVLDAGANDGATAVMLARVFSPLQQQVLAVEPLRSNIRVVY